MVVDRALPHLPIWLGIHGCGCKCIGVWGSASSLTSLGCDSGQSYPLVQLAGSLWGYMSCGVSPQAPACSGVMVAAVALILGRAPPLQLSGTMQVLQWLWVGSYPIRSGYIAIPAAMTMVVHGALSMYA